MLTFQLYHQTNGKHYFQLLAGSGQIIMSSDGYVKDIDCLYAIEQMKINIHDQGKIISYKMTNELCMFTVSGADNSVVAYSIPFDSINQCEYRISLLQEHLAHARLIEAGNL